MIGHDRDVTEEIFFISRFECKDIECHSISDNTVFMNGNFYKLVDTNNIFSYLRSSNSLYVYTFKIAIEEWKLYVI